VPLVLLEARALKAPKVRRVPREAQVLKDHKVPPVLHLLVMTQNMF
jgi:hypothetical protein